MKKKVQSESEKVKAVHQLLVPFCL